MKPDNTSLKRKRIIYTVQLGKNGGWAIYIRGQGVPKWNYVRKADAVAFITKRAGHQWKADQIKTQVICKGKNGRIQWERGYPDDTPRRKG